MAKTQEGGTMGVLWYFRFMGYMGAIFGQFPVESLKAEIFQISFFSSWGAWCIFAVLGNIVIAQSVFVAFHLIKHIAVDTFSAFDTRMMSFNGIFHSFKVYIIYVAFLLSLPKFLLVCRKLRLFDRRFDDLTSNNRLRFFLAVLYSSVWWFEAGTSIVYVRTIYRTLTNDPETLLNFKEMSWLLGNKYGFDLHIEFLFNFLISVHICFCQIANGFAIQYILALSYTTAHRLKAVELKILAIAQDQDHESVSPVISEMWRKFGKPKQATALEIDTIISQITSLSDIFSTIRDASGGIILLVMGTSTIGATILVYTCLNFIRLWKEEYIFDTAIIVFLYLILEALKILWLSNCGEFVMKQVRI
jgi:hypothetical protein